MRRSQGLLAIFAVLIASTALSPSALGADIEADLAVKSDARTLANQLETYYTNHQHYPGRRAVTYDGARSVKIGKVSLRLNRGDRLSALRLASDRETYCIHVVRAKGASDTTKPWSYVSDNGGFIAGGCPRRFSKDVA